MFNIFTIFSDNASTTDTRFGKSKDFLKLAKEISKKERRTVVVKTDHSAVIADLKYIYFCADYVINN